MTCLVPVITEAELLGHSSQVARLTCWEPSVQPTALLRPSVVPCNAVCVWSCARLCSAVAMETDTQSLPRKGLRCRAAATEAGGFHVPSAENKQCSSCDPWEQEVLPKPEAGSNRVHSSRPEVWLALVRNNEERCSTTLHGTARECCHSTGSERHFESQRLWHET